MKKAIKRIAAGLGVLFLAVLVVAAICGLPSPPGATTSGVPRIAWTPLLRHLPTMAMVSEATSFAAWDPRGGMIIRGRGRLQERLLRVAEPGADPEITPIPPRTGVLAFNPDDERRYAVYARDEEGNEAYQLFRWDLETDEQTMLTDGESRHAMGPFSRDGTLLGFTSTARNGKDRDIYTMDPTDPSSAKMVLEVEGSWHVKSWSPDGDRVLVSEYISSARSNPYVLDIATGKIEPVVDLEPASSFSTLTWGADENTVFVVTDRGDEFKRLMKVDLAAKQMTPLGEPFGWDVAAVTVSRDRSKLGVVSNEDGYRRAWLVDPETGDRRRLQLPDGSYAPPRFHPDGTRVAFHGGGQSGIASVFSYSLEDDELTKWTHAPADDGEPLPPLRLVRYPTFDELDEGGQREIPAFVYDPPESSPQPAPVLIWIHGGPAGQSRAVGSSLYNAMRREFGLAVIAPNVRGSRGYGKTNLALDDGRKREDSVRDIGTLLDWIHAQPEYDANRVIVYGGSYGGYMVLASMLRYANRIRCGIDIVGISNFVTFLQNTKEYRRDLRRREYGDERDPAMREFLESISPANRIDEIKGALLVIQGANDPRVPVTESRQIVETLEQLERRVWYIEYDNEGHGVRAPQNVAYSALAGFEFIGRCLE